MLPSDTQIIQDGFHEFIHKTKLKLREFLESNEFLVMLV